jgi:hypothetical protein
MYRKSLKKLKMEDGLEVKENGLLLEKIKYLRLLNI